MAKKEEAGRLSQFIQRVENLEEEKKALTTDIKEVYAEAKEAGFVVKAMRELVKIRKMDDEDRHDHETNMAIYKNYLGMDDQPNLFEQDVAKAEDNVGAGSKKVDIVKQTEAVTH